MLWCLRCFYKTTFPLDYRINTCTLHRFWGKKQNCIKKKVKILYNQDTPTVWIFMVCLSLISSSVETVGKEDPLSSPHSAWSLTPFLWVSTADFRHSDASVIIGFQKVVRLQVDAAFVWGSWLNSSWSPDGFRVSVVASFGLVTH